MQLRKIALMVAALGVVLAGCPNPDENEMCTTNADCLESELCHPTAGVCVQTCNLAADCPDTAKNCEALGGTSTDKDTKVCKCTSGANQCNLGRAENDRVCSPQGVCVQKCTENANCGTGETCEVATGLCKSTTPACTIGSCGANQVCGTSGCVAGPSCTGTAQGSCAYGQYCGTGTCKDVPVAPANCENFSSNRPAFSATSTGPVIYSVEGVTYQTNSQYCQASAPDAFIVKVRAYRTDTNWPDTRAGLSGFFYVTTQSTQLDVVNSGLLVPNTGYNRSASNPKDAEFNVYLCRPANSQSLQVGFFFTGGNPVCQQVNR